MSTEIFFLYAHTQLSVFVFPPCLVLFVQEEKLEVPAHRVPCCLFGGNVTTGISHSSKKAV